MVVAGIGVGAAGTTGAAGAGAGAGVAVAIAAAQPDQRPQTGVRVGLKRTHIYLSEPTRRSSVS